ncbi:MAG: type II toxin-antitoxin system RelE/ParE family toxin [Candidatus Cloacimonetes bacterium]|nr:type II toxin-antitoxin system RelE/ParE family toxin [Candidatus Cloacimonadota bacterium]
MEIIVLYTIIQSKIFKEWFESINDKMLIHKIRMCIDRMTEGNFGDCQSVGSKVSEVKIHYGSGYRLYFTIRKREIVVLLCGGDKSSQKKDILKAKELAKEV